MATLIVSAGSIIFSSEVAFSEERPLRFSVIVLARNMERYVRQCLQSILSLNNPGMEVIVVDAGSTDSTPTILRDFEDHPRLTALKIEDIGPSAARNAGLARAREEFIVYLDANDIPLVENWKHVLRKLAAHPEAVLAYGGHRPRGLVALSLARSHGTTTVFPRTESSLSSSNAI